MVAQHHQGMGPRPLPLDEERKTYRRGPVHKVGHFRAESRCQMPWTRIQGDQEVEVGGLLEVREEDTQ